MPSALSRLFPLSWSPRGQSLVNIGRRTRADPPPSPPPPAPATVETNAAAEADRPVDFVCEDDVRQAVENDRRIAVNDRTIITPAARDLGERHRVFRQA